MDVADQAVAEDGDGLPPPVEDVNLVGVREREPPVRHREAPAAAVPAARVRARPAPPRLGDRRRGQDAPRVHVDDVQPPADGVHGSAADDRGNEIATAFSRQHARHPTAGSTTRA